MKQIFAALSVLALALPAGATPVNHDNAYTEQLGEQCEVGSLAACRQLATVTNGQCAGPAGSGCHYDSQHFVVIDPEEPMVRVPGLTHLGWSRLSTVQHCVYLENVNDWSNLMTDYELERMEACLIEHT